MDTKNANFTKTITIGIPEAHRDQAARLYDLAFGAKLSPAIPNPTRRLELLSNTFDLDYGIAAIADDKLVGIAGYSTSDGALTSGIDYKTLLSQLGFIAGNRAAAVLSLYDRKHKPGELLMDGIVVDSDFRSQGIGSTLFKQLMQLASTRGYTTIRLDVIDTNPAARRLYERLGFTATKTEKFEFLRSLLGFGAATTMIYTL